MAAGPPAAPAPFSLRPLLLPALRSRPLHSGPHPPSHLQPHAAAWFAQLVLDRWFPPAGRPWRPQRPGLGPQQPDPAAQGRKAAANHTQPHGLRLPSPAWSASPRGPCACAWLPPERGLEPQSQLQGRGQRRLHFSYLGFRNHARDFPPLGDCALPRGGACIVRSSRLRAQPGSPRGLRPAVGKERSPEGKTHGSHPDDSVG
nr:uncharacterized protein LOC109731357 isoform X1 [Microcebus murinus]